MGKDVKTRKDIWEKMLRRRRKDGKRYKDEERYMGKDIKTRKDIWEKM
jgi:hypothetical protein